MFLSHVWRSAASALLCFKNVPSGVTHRRNESLHGPIKTNLQPILLILFAHTRKLQRAEQLQLEWCQTNASFAHTVIRG